MKKSPLLMALPLALAVSAVALADNDASVETLKAALPSTHGFEVEDVRMGDDGASCITYRVANDLEGESRLRAVVKGDKVLREVPGNAKFAKAWNSQCAGKG